MDVDQLLVLPLWYLAFLLSVTCHEAAHGLAAHRGGDSTAYHGGQVTLNPLPHIAREPFGTVLVPLLTYLNMGWMMGWASAPYDPVWEDRHPRRAAAMAAAGPLANLVLAAIAFVTLKVGLGLGWWRPHLETDAQGRTFYRLDHLVMPSSLESGNLEGLGRLCSVVLSLNALLFLFNLIPLPPLDGASVVAGLWRPARRLREQLRANPWAALGGLLLAWVALGYVFNPVYDRVLTWLYGGP